MSDQPRPAAVEIAASVEGPKLTEAPATTRDGRPFLDPDAIGRQLSNSSTINERKRALVELRDGTTGVPAQDGALLLNRIEVDPDKDIRAGAATIYARRAGIPDIEKFHRLTERLQIRPRYPLEPENSVRFVLAREAMRLPGVSFDLKTEVLDRLCRYNLPQAGAEAVAAGKALVTDQTLPPNDRLALVHKLSRSPHVNTRVVAIQIAGELTQLPPNELIKVLQAALADGAQDTLTTPSLTSTSRQVALEAIDVTLGCSTIDASTKLQLLQQDIGNLHPTINIHRARAALAVVTGKSVATVKQALGKNEIRDAAYREITHRWIDGHGTLTPETRAVLHQLVERPQQ